LEHEILRFAQDDVFEVRSLAEPVPSECEGLGMTKRNFAQDDRRG
jgi:hypothetical protein